MRIIIAGSRSFGKQPSDEQQLELAMDHFPTITEIVSGGAVGADLMGEAWAYQHAKRVKKFLPDWSLGKKAGPLRNAAMADYADAAIVFWDGKSRGSKNMIDEMKKRSKPVEVVLIHCKPL